MTRPQEPSDDQRILETLQRYVRAVDDRRFELFDDTFSSEATLDYRSAGGPIGSREAIRDWLRSSREALLFWQHHLSPPMIERAGDSARTRTDVYTPNVFLDPEGGRSRVLHTGGRYHDELQRLPEGWRIVHRRFETTWADGAGVGTLIPEPNYDAQGDPGD